MLQWQKEPTTHKVHQLWPFQSWHLCADSSRPWVHCHNYKILLIIVSTNDTQVVRKLNTMILLTECNNSTESECCIPLHFLVNELRNSLPVSLTERETASFTITIANSHRLKPTSQVTLLDCSPVILRSFPELEFSNLIFHCFAVQCISKWVVGMNAVTTSV